MSKFKDDAWKKYKCYPEPYSVVIYDRFIDALTEALEAQKVACKVAWRIERDLLFGPATNLINSDEVRRQEKAILNAKIEGNNE